MSNFEWQTEEDFDWDAPQENAGSQSRRWMGIVFFILLVAVGYSIYARLNSTVLSATQQVENEVQAAHQTVFTAADQRDLELFNGMLSGRDRTWTVGQQQLIGGEGLLARSPFGMEVMAAIPAIESVELSADLNAALITSTIPYSIHVGDGITTTIQLISTHVMRRSTDDLWLYAPPLPEFWGETIHVPPLFSSYRPLFSAEFPTRDHAIVERLVDDLALAYEQICILNRPSNVRNWADECYLLHYDLIFSTDPATLANDLSATTQLPERFTLPTPTLVGLPQDEAGYRALFAGYALQIFPPIIATLTDYDCCDQKVYFDGLVAWQLEQVGVPSLSLSQQAYRHILAKLPDIAGGAWAWEQTDAPTAQAIINYLLTTYPELTGDDVVTSLNESRIFATWLQTLLADVPVSADSETLKQQQAAGLHRFLMTNIGDAEPPIPFPDEDILLLCEAAEGMSLHEYDTATSTISELHPFPDMAYGHARSLSQREAVWVEQLAPSFEDEERVTYLYRESGIVPLRELTGSSLRLHSTMSSEFTGLIAYSVQGSAPQFAMLDVDSCDAADCPLITNTVPSLYSPNGNYIITSSSGTNAQTQLVTSEGRVIRALVPNGNYIWLSDTIYAVRLGNLGLMLYAVDGEDPLYELSQSDFEAILPSSLKRPTLRQTWLQTVVQRGNQVYIVVQAFDGDGDAAILAIDLQTFAIELVTTFADASLLLDFSPNERYLSFHKWPTTGGQYEYVLYDLQAQTIQAFPAFDNQMTWSADGNWLMIMGDGFGRLFAPEHDYIDFITPPNHCTSAAWFSPPAP